jgi:hypothetical protein
MSNEDIRPTSIVGIKRLAKSLKAESGIPHHQALNLAARRAGFENFRHAGKQLPTLPSARTAPPGHRLYITGAWKDRDTGARGGETTWVDLSALWADLVTRAQMQAQRSLVRLIPEAEDHLTYQYMFGSQSEARRAICAALRTFQFMDATKLRPTRAHSRVYPGGSSSNAIPGRDHSGSWYDPVSKGYVFADEPYEPKALEYAAARATWGTQHDYEIAKPDWRGMYHPGGEGGSRLYLVASRRKGPSVAGLAAALNRLPPPIVVEQWKGESAQGLERFKSPAELQRAGASAPLAMVAPKPPRQTAARAQQQPRPGRMPIEVHEEIGSKLKTVMADTFRRSGVYNRVDVVRSKLDDWIQREYDATALPMERFSEVYYGSAPPSTFARSLTREQRAQHVSTLGEVKALLTQHYSDSQLRSMIGKLDAAARSLETWAP